MLFWLNKWGCYCQITSRRSLHCIENALTKTSLPVPFALVLSRVLSEPPFPLTANTVKAFWQRWKNTLRMQRLSWSFSWTVMQRRCPAGSRPSVCFDWTFCKSSASLLAQNRCRFYFFYCLVVFLPAFFVFIYNFSRYIIITLNYHCYLSSCQLSTYLRIYCYFYPYYMLHCSATRVVSSLNKVNKVAAAEFALTCSHRFPSCCSELLLSAPWVSEVCCLCCTFILLILIPTSAFFQSHGHQRRSAKLLHPSRIFCSPPSPPLSSLVPIGPAPLLSYLPWDGGGAACWNRSFKDQSGRTFISLIPLNPQHACI